MRVLIIIPAYNEQESILAVAESIEQVKIPRTEIDILVINDCSTDRTGKLLLENHIPHISLKCNLGIGGAVQTGYKYALENGYDVAVQFDGDGQHPSEYLPDVIMPIIKGDADYVIGSRFIGNEGYLSTPFRRFGISVLSVTIMLFGKQKIHDVTSGFRAVNRELIKFFATEYADDYPEPEAIISAIANGARIIEVPVKMNKRSFGKSTINPIRSIYYMFKVTLSIALIKHKKK